MSITIDPEAVFRVSQARASSGTAGEELSAGDVVYLLDGTLLLADNNTAPEASVRGICLNAAFEGQPVAFLAAGTLEIGPLVTPGHIYVLSTAGEIEDAVDLGSGDYVAILGTATSQTEILISLINTGVAR